MFANIDKFIVLSLLKNRKDTEKKFYSIFKEKESRDKLQFYYVQGVGSFQNNGKMNTNFQEILSHTGCNAISKDIFKNHLSIIRTAKKNKWKNLLIFEEDAYIVKKEKIKRNIKAIDTWIKDNSSNFDILYLGYCNWPIILNTPTNILKPYIVRPKSPLLLHSYILSERGINKILDFFENKGKSYEEEYIKKNHIDKFFSNSSLGLEKFAIFPQIVFQNPPALFVKACDQLGIKITFENFIRLNENISIIIFLILFFFIFYCFFRIIFFCI